MSDRDRVQTILREFKAETAPEAFLQQEIKSLLADLDEALSAPVPAPRLEWTLDKADAEAPAWRLGDFWVYGDAEGAWEVYIDNDDISFCQRGLTLDAAKSLAEKLEAVLYAPPVGPQPKEN